MRRASVSPASPVLLLLALGSLGTLSACGSSSDEATPGGSGGSGGSSAAGGSGGSSGSSAAGGSAGTSSGATGGGAGIAGQAGNAGSGGAASCASLSGTSGTHDETLSSSGRERTVHVHVPQSYDPGAETMLVLAFHGWLEQSTELETISKLSEASDAHGFIVAYPQGLSQSWNAGKCCGSPPGENNDDVLFARDLVAHLSSEYCVDPKRVYATGFSNGAMMSHRLGCEAADLFAAIGPVSGQLAVDTCAPSRPVPVWEVQGTSDLILQFNGLGTLDQTVARWVDYDGCTDTAPAEIFKNGAATCNRYSACEAGSVIDVCEIQGGGHQWPSGVSTGPIGGTLSNDLDASEQIYEFFAAHPMP